MADNVMTAKTLIKEAAQHQGLHASFMPKPNAGVNGSGMHIHMSLFSKGRNAFAARRESSTARRLGSSKSARRARDHHLSGVAERFVAGLLRHAPEITLVTNQWVNSYKRLTPGYEAPVYVCWAHMNRSALIRVPAYQPGREESARVEYRAPDPACNPYLAFSVLLAAGLEGIERGYHLAPEATDNIYRLTPEELSDHGITTLPGDLSEAIRIAEKSTLLAKALGRSVFEFLIRNKKLEWDEYRTRVTEYETQRYLPVL